MYLNINRNLAETKEQLALLVAAIEEHEGALPFDSVAVDNLLQKHQDFLQLDVEYTAARVQSQIHRQLRYNANKQLYKKSLRIAQYLKVKLHSNTKKLGEWGITLVYGKSGRIKFSRRLLPLEEMYLHILSKHLADGENSVLNRYDMDVFSELTNQLIAQKTAYQLETAQWRSISKHRLQKLKELIAMQRKIARDMLSRTDMLPKDLELWGFRLVEQHGTDLPLAS